MWHTNNNKMKSIRVQPGVLNSHIKSLFMRKKVFVLLIPSIVAVFTSCKKELSCEGCMIGNKPPVANAGRDTMITLPFDSIKLNGNGSYDPDGSITEWQWTRISGPSSFVFNNEKSAKTTVTNLAEGVYRFELNVTDNGGLSARDTVLITVQIGGITNQPPVANAGSDQTITLPTNTVILNGSKSADPDNNITSYSWVKIAGPSSFNIANANTVQTQVSALVKGVYKFELNVTDAGNLFSRDTVQITVNESEVNSSVEFIFDNLTWSYFHHDNDPDSLWDEVYVHTPDKPDLFSNPGNQIQVFVKSDTDTDWVQAHPVINGACTPPYTYQRGGSAIVVFVCSTDLLRFVGKKVSLKVIF